jgi:hypothetical protein
MITTSITRLTKHLTNSVTSNCSNEFMSGKRVIASANNSWNVSSIFGASRDSDKVAIIVTLVKSILIRITRIVNSRL